MFCCKSSKSTRRTTRLASAIQANQDFQIVVILPITKTYGGG